MKYFLAALLLSVSAPALADNIAGCEVVLMERIEQEGLEGSAEVASFRPAEDFIASIYDEESEVLREIDGLPIRAIMCKRQSIIPSLRDFPIVATGTPFMISQNFDSAETGLTTVWFKDGEFRHSYKGPDLDKETQAEMKDRLEVFNLQPHELAEKEKAMQDMSASSAEKKPKSNEVASEDELIGISKEDSETSRVASEDELIAISKEGSKTHEVASEDELIGISKDDSGASSTEESQVTDDSKPESTEEKEAAKKEMKRITKEQHETYK